MAALVLTVGAAVLTGGAAAWVTTLATAAAAVAGSYIDAFLFGPGPMKQEGPRLDNLQIQASTEGAAIPEIAGRVRLAGQIIWATKFKEVAKTETGGGGKGGGPTVTTTTYTYYANFAVGLCEGVIDRIGRIWADGKPLDMSGVTMRVYRGTADQPPDPLIEGIEGTANAPAYRGTAYVVFENLEITQFGNRLPQLSFELFRRVSPSDGSGLEDIVQAITLIPGAGERVYDTVVHTRDLGGGATMPENKFAGQDTADWNVALGALEASIPNANTVLLVVGWFGDDLRVGNCTIRPKVEVSNKTTTPNAWKVHTLTRENALVMSTVDGRPAYGGTPSDDSVVRAIRDLKARGFTVVFYPFLFMDIAQGNALPDPWTGDTGQPAYPWRGRITCDPAPGRIGTADKTSAATGQVASFFGTASPSDIAVSVNASTNAVSTSYSGPDEWSYRRFILHYAKLCAAVNALDAGAVDAFLIGSEFRSLTTVRDSATTYPAVAKLKELADDVKTIMGAGVKVGYAADWSEYANHNPDDGTGDLFFHLDPLWADDNIDFVGVDLYVPLSDWREGNDHLDALAGAASIYDLDYLRSNIEGGEYFDWYYASQADRDAQSRSPIADGAYGKPWVYRAKDFRNWWLNQHFNRPGGIESGTPTAWVPESKPIWFTELGFPSVDKATNQPNVFYDPKSSESLLPHYSRGTRDDLIQRRGIEAVLTYRAANNPVSSVYDGPMIGKIAVWTWDARPYPAWPSRKDIWGDGDLWPLGHWLNGKVGLADLAALVAERCRRVGFTAYDVTALTGIVVGYVRDRPMSPRAEIELLMNAFAFDAVESEGVIRFLPRGRAAVAEFDIGDCVLPEQGDILKLTRAQETDLPDIVSITFIDGSKNYDSGTVSASRIAGYSERKTDVTVPLVMDETQAQAIADRALAEAWIGRETAQYAVPPDRIDLDAGDVINLVIDGRPREFRLTRISDAWSRSIEAQRCEGAVYAPPLPGLKPPVFEPPPVYGRAILELMDLPMLRDDDVGYAPYVGASATPFAGVTLMDSATGIDYAVDTVLPIRAAIGETIFDFWSGPTAYFDIVNTLRVKLYSGELASLDEATILSGRANGLAIRNADGDWEILQFCNAALVNTGIYDLTKLLRGRLGTEHAMRNPVAAGARVVLLDGAVAQIQAALAERGVSRFYKWGPSSLDPFDVAWQQATFTARCVGLMPWSPVHVAGIRNGAGDLSITWIRRTRFGGVWADGADVPLNEENERYEVDILDGADVVRTLSTTSPAATYTAAQQTADFGSPQASIAVAVYQLSAVVGRGWSKAATL
ncbi:glycoside hydrolase/phage tail family protein [Pseudorhodoplanes sp.]|uniref:baseplate multidomain protein megatron n=1 Tax=Pseudorhodoplanes sp. TaxID=1934341 RepID=UPI00391DE9D0